MRMVQSKTQALSKFLRKPAYHPSSSYMNADLEPVPAQKPDLSQFSSERSSKLNFVNTSKKTQLRPQKLVRVSKEHIIEIEQFNDYEEDITQYRKPLQR